MIFVKLGLVLVDIVAGLRRWIREKRARHVEVVEGKEYFAERAAKLVSQYDCCLATVRSSMIAHYSKGLPGYFRVACDELSQALLKRSFKKYKAMISLPRCRSDVIEDRMTPIDYENRLKNLKMCLSVNFQYEKVPIFYPPQVQIIPSEFSHIVQTHLYYHEEDERAEKGTLLLMLQGKRGEMSRGIVLSRASRITQSIKAMLDEWVDCARNIAVKRAEECGYNEDGENKHAYKKYKEQIYPDLRRLGVEQDADLKVRIWLVEECIPRELEWLKRWEEQEKRGEDSRD